MRRGTLSGNSAEAAAVFDHPQSGRGVVVRLAGRVPALALVEAPRAGLALGDVEPELGHAESARRLDHRGVEAPRQPAPPLAARDEQVAHVAQLRIVDRMGRPDGGDDGDLPDDLAVSLGDDAVEVLLPQ